MIAMEVKYKKTGIDWIPEVPEHWDIVRLKWVLKNGEGIKIGPFGSSLKLQDLDDNGIRVYGQENVIKDDFSLGKRFLSKEKFEELSVYEVFPQDILVTMMGTTGKCKLVPEDAEKGIMDSHLIRLRANDKIRPEFLSILINDSTQLKYQMSVDSKGSIMSGLNSKIVKNLLLPLPSISDQDLILEKIKTESAQISRFLQSKQRFIELLKEQRQSIITNAVTRGIDENVKMKETGIVWMPEVPEHWEVRRFKNICLLQRGHDLPKEQFKEGEFPVLGSNGIIGYHNEYTTKAPCITIGRSGSVGEINYVEKDFWAHNTCLFVKENHGNDWRYLFFLVSSIDIKMVSNGSAVPTLDRKNVHSLRIAFPSTVNEQTLIVEHIKTETRTLDIAIDKAEREIELMKEYREAMIAEAVTGKKIVNSHISG